MKIVPEFVDKRVLSRISLSCCTCGANSDPNVAVAIRQPPSSIDLSVDVSCDDISKESTVSSNLGSCKSKSSNTFAYTSV